MSYPNFFQYVTRLSSRTAKPPHFEHRDGSGNVLLDIQNAFQGKPGDLLMLSFKGGGSLVTGGLGMAGVAAVL
jgi:hypothetical protein